MIIDSHHHLWRYSASEYDWITREMKVLQRDFLPDMLAGELAAAGVDGAVAVQARQSLEETRWLLDLARRHSIIKGVVGWVPLVAKTVAGDLERFAADAKLRGVRHVLQGERDDRYMLRDDFNRGIGLLARHALRFDILIFARQLPIAAELVDRHPNQVFILDHIAKPRIGSGDLTQWRDAMRRLAERANVYCKLSGMVTEADWNSWTPEMLRPYAEGAIEAFGPGRIMFGSDWPVCLVASGYDRWVGVVKNWIAGLSPDEQSRILGKTAIEAYGLSA